MTELTAREKTLKFTVDSRLLEELGERLVGKPSTALAELVKNAYDADATVVQISLEQSGGGRLIVADNGHGMTFEEFENYWMRVGSQHKRDRQVSRNLSRPLTGSKGVGRIAAQILSRSLRIVSVPEDRRQNRLLAHLDWGEAIKTGDLIDVEVQTMLETLSEPQEPGTMLILEGLKQEWSVDDIEQLAREIWRLQPPFARNVPRKKATAKDFRVQFGGPEGDLVEAFNKQVQAILQLWSAKAIGENAKGVGIVSLQFNGEDAQVQEFELETDELRNGRFELRFYDLQGRQPHGIRVADAREYLQEFGGVHIYDSGFRLPFYGEKDNDWLLISHDTARRITFSGLLPRELQVRRGLLSLPQWYQIVGVVEINSSEEPGLEVTITRDRLVESREFFALRDFVRRAIHWYANEKARRRVTNIDTPIHTESSARMENLFELLSQHQEEIPSHVAGNMRSVLKDIQEGFIRKEREIDRRIAALSAFATAGIAAVGYQHELHKQLLGVEKLGRTLPDALQNPETAKKAVAEISNELIQWVERARQLGRMFSHLIEPENLEAVRRFSAKSVVESVIEQVEPIRRQVRIDLENLDTNLHLPAATYTEWVSIFQNALTNAFNALIDSDDKVIRIRSDSTDERERIFIEDTGSGVDLESANQLFEPLVRRAQVSRERRELGFGGSGLGLTIMRMVGAQRGVDIHFTEPENRFSTALVLSWPKAG